MSRRSDLTVEVRLAMDRATIGPDPAGLGFLTPEAFESLSGLSRDVHGMAYDLNTAKFHSYWDGVGRSLDGIIDRLRNAPDGPTARNALYDLYVMLTDEDCWR